MFNRTGVAGAVLLTAVLADFAYYMWYLNTELSFVLFMC